MSKNLCYFLPILLKALFITSSLTFGVKALTIGTTKNGTTIAILAANGEFVAPIVNVRIIKFTF